MTTIQIDAQRCKTCGTCVQICPAGIFAQPQQGTVPTILDTAHCLDCGHCVAICPNAAISHSAFPVGSIHPLHPEMLPSTEQAMTLLRSRRSVREFRHQPVEPALLEQVIEAARFAPSAHNVQSTEFIVVQDPTVLSQMVKLTVDQMTQWHNLLTHPVIRSVTRLVTGKANQSRLDEFAADFAALGQCYAQGADPVLHHAPVLLLFHANQYAGFAGTNANLALQNASLICETLGLGAFYTGYVVAAGSRNAQIAKLLNLPPYHKIYAGLAIGHPKFRYHHWIERRPAQVTWC